MVRLALASFVVMLVPSLLYLLLLDLLLSYAHSCIQAQEVKVSDWLEFLAANGFVVTRSRNCYKAGERRA